MAKKDTTDTSEPAEEVVTQEQVYAFPEMGMTVSATSQEEAQKKISSHNT